MRKILVVDSETTGKSLNFHASYTDTVAWPRVIELAWELFWEDGTTIETGVYLVYPDGWVVPTGEFWIKHGFDTFTNQMLGIPMPEVLEKFIVVLEQADLLVAHNLGFDLPTIMCEMHRYNMFPSKRTDKYCTKLKSTARCKIDGLYGRYKWPTLQEAYECFYGPMPDGAHRADFDVWACKMVFLALRFEEQMLGDDIINH